MKGSVKEKRSRTSFLQWVQKLCKKIINLESTLHTNTLNKKILNLTQREIELKMAESSPNQETF
jgi:hypothetical protein